MFQKVQKSEFSENILSHFYDQIKECTKMRKEAKFWFGPLLSFTFPNQSDKIRNDLTKSQYEQLLTSLTNLVSDMMSFYVKNPPEQVYKLLHIARGMFGLGFGSSEDLPKISSMQGYTLLMHQIYFNNTLSLFLMKNKQYSYAFQCFQFILDVIRNDKIDIYDQIILVATSNYLALVRMQQYGIINDKIKEISEHLQNIYNGLLNKYLKSGCAQNSLLCLLSTYKQNEKLLSKRFQAQNKLLIKKYQQINHLKEAHFLTDENRIQYYMLMTRLKRITKLQIKLNEINFIAPSTLANNLRINRLSNSIELRRQYRTNSQSESWNKLQLQKSVRDSKGFQKSDLKKSKLLSEQFSNYNKTIDNQLLNRAIKKLSTQKRIELQKKNEKKKHIKIYFKNQPVVIKVNYSIIQVINDGIIISDFLQERKKFLTWYEIFNIIRYLRFSNLFNQYIPISCYYDVAKILSSYIYKSPNDYHWGAIILDVPKQIVQIDMFTKLYKSQGPYLKVFIMNKFDFNHLELCIDFYLDQFQQYFKNLTVNQYIEGLNKKIVKQNYYKESKVCSLQIWKKTKQSAISNLSSKFHTEQILDTPFLKSSQFKMVIMMPKNVEILVYLKQKQLKQEQQKNSSILPITVTRLKSEQHSQKKLNIPLYKIYKYFPIQSIGLSVWLKKHGKYITEGYIQCFQNYPASLTDGQYFDIITYAKKVQMVDQGKYKSPVIAQMIGTKKRIWGIAFRYYQIFSAKQITTFIFNPYHELYKPVIKLGAAQRKDILLEHLIQSSVSKTYKKLEQAKLLKSMVNIIDYWNLIQF